MDKSLKFEAISVGWNTIKKNIATISIAFLLSLVVLLGGGLLAFLPLMFVMGITGATGMDFAQNQSSSIGIILLIFIIYIYAYAMIFYTFTALSLAYTKMAFLMLENQKISFKALFPKFKLVISSIVAGFVYGNLVTVGIYLLIIPGIILGIKHRFYSFILLDRSAVNDVSSDAFQSLMKSGVLARDNKLQLFLFDLLRLLLVILIVLLASLFFVLKINILGIILLICLYPVFLANLISHTYVYRKLAPKA